MSAFDVMLLGQCSRRFSTSSHPHTRHSFKDGGGGNARISSGFARGSRTTFSRWRGGQWANQQFRSNSAHSKILILLLAFNRPTDLLTGQKIDTGDALYQGNTKEFHHFFPRDYLISKGQSPRRASLLANFIMLTAASNKRITNRAPSDYLKDVKAFA